MAMFFKSRFPIQISPSFIPSPNVHEVSATFWAPLRMFVEPRVGQHSSEVIEYHVSISSQVSRFCIRGPGHGIEGRPVSL